MENEVVEPTEQEVIGSNEVETPSWYIDEGIAANVDRPEWFPEKFKTVKDAMKSLGELEKKLGSAPDDYDFGEFKDIYNPEHEAFQELKQFAKEKRVPQEVVSKMLESFTSYGKSLLPDAESEKAKLGENADKRIEILKNWASSNFGEQDGIEFIESLPDAKSFMVVEKMRKQLMENNPTITNGSEPNEPDSLSVEDVQKEMQENYDKFKTDSAYRNELKKKMELAAKKAGIVDKTGF